MKGIRGNLILFAWETLDTLPIIHHMEAMVSMCQSNNTRAITSGVGALSLVVAAILTMVATILAVDMKLNDFF